MTGLLYYLKDIVLCFTSQFRGLRLLLSLSVIIQLFLVDGGRGSFFQVSPLPGPK